MNERQMADRIGNIDDRLVQQAGRPRDYKSQRQIRLIRRLAACAATFILMAGSFAMGMVVQARQDVEGTAIEDQIVELEDFHLALILPDTWKGRYGVERTAEDTYTFYSTETRCAPDDDGFGGNLFYIVRWGEPLTEEQVKAGGEWDVVGNEYIMATKTETYLLYYVSDVEYTPTTEALYKQMLSELPQIRFVTDSMAPAKEP